MLVLTTAMLFAGTIPQAEARVPSPPAASTTASTVAPSPASPLADRSTTPVAQTAPTASSDAFQLPASATGSATPSATASAPASGPVLPVPAQPVGFPVDMLPTRPISEGAVGTSGAAPAGSETDILIVGRKQEKVGDPLRAVNATAFGATQAVDDAVVGPVALAYKRNVPSPIRQGIHNFLYNLREPIVFLNFLLQFKVGKAAETVGRFAINSTAGALGVLDIAKRRPFKLPRRSNGFANTLGYHGVKNGPFLFLPLVGPTTLRDLIGGTLDRLILPTAVGSPFTSPTYTIPAGVLGAVDHRADFDETLHDLHDGSPDPYAASREFYLQRRQAEIDHLRGRDVRKPVSADFRVTPRDPTLPVAPPPPGP